MIAIVRRRDEVFVVDANLDDYVPLIKLSGLQEVNVHWFSTGEEALRAAGACPPTHWVVNIRLPDMSGIGVLTFVRHRMRHCTVYLVGDKYSAEDEFAARLAGATAYVCKPANVAWLDGCRPRCRSPANRGPTSLCGSPAAMRPP